jgi:hypothetical protein
MGSVLQTRHVDAFGLCPWSGAGERQERVARDPRKDAARRIKYMDNRRAATMRDLTRQGCSVFCCREERVAMLRIKSVQESDL